MSANEYQPLINRMKEIIPVIKEADDAYYKYSNPIMTDFRYDQQGTAIDQFYCFFRCCR